MSVLSQIFNKIDSLVWGPPLLILLVGTGIYLTLRLGLLQIFKLPLALKYVFAKDDELEEEGDVSSFAALCTALSATIGTGNIVGVATALKAGGPGAIFWMWVAAFFGMATKYAEGLLAVKYRTVDENGQMAGGPMYYIEKGLGKKWLAKIFAIFGIGVAFFGIGTFAQVKAITQVVNVTFNIPIIIPAVIITALVALVTIGGIKNIAAVAEKVVPFMAAFYIVGCVIILLFNASALPTTIKLIMKSAFTPTAAVGGFLGTTVMKALQSGIARGVFSNESGLGSAPIAAAAAKTKSCVRQGLISMTGTFFDTILICTMTGLVLILTGAWSSNLEGAAMTTYAFNSGLPIPYLGKIIVAIGLIFFAFTTILGWNYYGERCVVYLAGVKAIKPYKIIYIVLVGMGSFIGLDLIWIIADIVNGLMAIPNLIALVGLSGVIIAETKKFFEEKKQSDSLEKSNIDGIVQ
ncbi:sodium:alanine symporter family protein [Clostridium botulinum]|uniref:Sodium:alanine symporter n=1 Tax=Clostridium botulinum C/D str. DC5 TaxID=1443128 RepID=A0A0A0IGG3_CLOBO|nr:sodium:alanine symporter family protein [Clostridium botulinum]KGN00073.1 sodium:alanine symporter [Clostridium botulinum C/D str. DC5]KOC55739.1 sodium:alanine symporter [Clostridium botulinum]KOC57198.1 sodium:alanine symporter [Clostridium botulinum]MCD3234453.1 sodium:alanine symporter family protein [Clostridium botulinum D/C]MCD3240349.1 sodium:alanine symporter family protein [Clostridium botulinum D/C]